VGSSITVLLAIAKQLALRCKSAQKLFFESCSTFPTRTRARPTLQAQTFTVVFYGSKIFCCKTAQLSETLRKSVCVHLALKNRLRNIAKSCANTR
jgi:hypothetical protein